MTLGRVLGLVALVAIALVPVLPLGAAEEYIWHVIIQIFLWSFVGNAWSLMGRFGLVSLGHGAFLGVGAYATVLLWKALDPRYIDEAGWIVDTILKPLHPLGVWLVSVIMPPLRTLVSNMPPTHLDADKVLYGFLVPIYMALIIGLFRMLRWLVAPGAR